MPKNMDDPGASGLTRVSASRRPSQGSDYAPSFDSEARPFLLPTRWWFASTAIPLVAVRSHYSSIDAVYPLRLPVFLTRIFQGAFGPVANAFSICALAQHWRSESTDHGTVTIKDPPWSFSLP